MKNLSNLILSISVLIAMMQAVRFRTNANRATIFSPDSLDVNLTQNIRVILNESFVKLLDLQLPETDKPEQQLVYLQDLNFRELYAKRKFFIKDETSLLSKIKEIIKINIKSIAEGNTQPITEEIFNLVKEFLQYQLYAYGLAIDFQLETLYSQIVDAVQTQLNELLEVLRRRATWMSQIQLKAAYEFDETNPTLNNVRESIKTFLISGIQFRLQQALKEELLVDERKKSQEIAKVHKIINKIIKMNRNGPLTEITAELSDLLTELYERKTQTRPGNTKEYLKDVLTLTFEIIDVKLRPKIISIMLKAPSKKIMRTGTKLPGYDKFIMFIDQYSPSSNIVSFLPKIDKFNLLDKPINAAEFEGDIQIENVLGLNTNAFNIPFIFKPFELYDSSLASVFAVLYEVINNLREKNRDSFIYKPALGTKLIEALREIENNSDACAAILIVKITLQPDIELFSSDVKHIDLEDPAIVALKRNTLFRNLLNSLIAPKKISQLQKQSGKSLIHEKSGKLTLNQASYLEDPETITQLLKNNAIDLQSFISNDSENTEVTIILLNSVQNVCYQENIAEFFSNQI